MDLKIKVGDPILEPGEMFVVRYRLLPSGSWVNFGTVTENEFIIPSLYEGNYEIGISWEDCDEVIVTATVPPDPVTPCDCPEVQSVVINESCKGQHTMVVMFAPGSLFNACTYRIYHGSGYGPDIIPIGPDGSTPISIIGWTDHTSLSNPLTIPVASTQNQVFGLSVYCCETDEWKICHPIEVVETINPCSCVSMLNISAAEATDLPGGQTRVDYTFTGSDPNIPPYSGRVYDANSNHNFSVSSPGVNQIVVPFVLQDPATIELTNRCGTNRRVIVSTAPDCESDPEVTFASRLAWNGFLYPATSGYAMTMTFVENGTLYPGGYVIEIIDPSAPLGSQVVATHAVSSEGTYIIPIQKQYYTLEPLHVRVVSCQTSNEEYIHWN